MLAEKMFFYDHSPGWPDIQREHITSWMCLFGQAHMNESTTEFK